MRDAFLPFARPSLGEEEIQEVAETLRSGWITTGPKTEKFAAAFADYVGGRFAVPVSSATAGLHVALLALGVGPGDEVITTPMTFVATLNTIVHCGATPVLADIDAATLHIVVDHGREALHAAKTKAILPVHFVGHAVDLDPLLALASSPRASRSSRTPPTRSAPSTRAAGSGPSRRPPSFPSTRTRTSRPARAAWS